MLVHVRKGSNIGGGSAAHACSIGRLYSPLPLSPSHHEKKEHTFRWIGSLTLPPSSFYFYYFYYSILLLLLYPLSFPSAFQAGKQHACILYKKTEKCGCGGTFIIQTEPARVCLFRRNVSDARSAQFLVKLGQDNTSIDPSRMDPSPFCHIFSVP
jgi:hypothetical protein